MPLATAPADMAGTTITAVDLAHYAGVPPKQFRAWMRLRKQAGDPLFSTHVKGSDWLFSVEDAVLVLMRFHIVHGRIDAPTTLKQLARR